MLIKNVSKGGRGLGVAGHAPIEWAPGETKAVDAAVIVEAKKDPANAALLADGGDLVEVNPVRDAQAKAQAAKAAAEEALRVAEAAESAAAKVADEKPAEVKPAPTTKPAKEASR